MVLIHTDARLFQLGLASDLISDINRTFGVFASYIRPRARYLVFCSSWTLLSGIVLVMLMALAEAAIAIVVQLIVYGPNPLYIISPLDLTRGD